MAKRKSNQNSQSILNQNNPQQLNQNGEQSNAYQTNLNQNAQQQSGVQSNEGGQNFTEANQNQTIGVEGIQMQNATKPNLQQSGNLAYENATENLNANQPVNQAQNQSENINQSGLQSNQLKSEFEQNGRNKNPFINVENDAHKAKEKKERNWVINAGNMAILASSLSLVIDVIHKLLRLVLIAYSGLIIFLYVLAGILSIFALIASIKYGFKQKTITVDAFFTGISFVTLILI